MLHEYVSLHFLSQYEVLEILDLPDPDVTPASSRTQLRLECEVNDFSDEHYLADHVHRSYIDEVIKFNTIREKDHTMGTPGKRLCLLLYIQVAPD
jgi:hypothetical protein